METLLRLAEDHMLTHDWIILLQFDPLGAGAAILRCVIDITAFGATELDYSAVALFRHDVLLPQSDLDNCQSLRWDLNP